MTHRDATPDASHLSTSQFAEREGVSRVFSSQLLAAGRIPGARKIGHHWIVPASAAIVRRAPGRPGRETRAEGRLLRALARRYVWWLPAREALARPNFVARRADPPGGPMPTIATFLAEFLRDAAVAAEAVAGAASQRRARAAIEKTCERMTLDARTGSAQRDRRFGAAWGAARLYDSDCTIPSHP